MYRYTWNGLSWDSSNSTYANYPFQIVIASDDTIYITGNGIFAKVLLDGTWSLITGGQACVQICIDANDDIYQTLMDCTQTINLTQLGSLVVKYDTSANTFSDGQVIAGSINGSAYNVLWIPNQKMATPRAALLSSTFGRIKVIELTG